MAKEENNKKTWKDVWERLTRLETKLDLAIANVQEIPRLCERLDELTKDSIENKEEHKSFVRSNAFYSWLGALATAIAIITTILFLMR